MGIVEALGGSGWVNACVAMHLVLLIVIVVLLLDVLITK